MLKVKVTAKRIKSGSHYVAHFRGEVSNPCGVDLPEVSLARRPDHCFFALDNLAAHDGHSPGFSSKETLETHIQRVFHDVQVALKKIADAPLVDRELVVTVNTGC